MTEGDQAERPKAILHPLVTVYGSDFKDLKDGLPTVQFNQAGKGAPPIPDADQPLTHDQELWAEATALEQTAHYLLALEGELLKQMSPSDAGGGGPLSASVAGAVKAGIDFFAILKLLTEWSLFVVAAQAAQPGETVQSPAAGPVYVNGHPFDIFIGGTRRS